MSIIAACPGAGPGQCIANFGDKSVLSNPTYINQYPTGQAHVGFPGHCTWYAADRVQQLTGVDLAKYGIWGNGHQWALNAPAKGFPVYWGASEAKEKSGTLAGYVISFYGIMPGYDTHVAVVEKENEDGSCWVSEMWGSQAGTKAIHLTLYPASAMNNKGMGYIDFSSIGLTAGPSKRYFKEDFGEFHWKIKPKKDALLPSKPDYNSFCKRLNQAQEKAECKNKINFSADQNSGTLTAATFNKMLQLMQESNEGLLLGVDKEECKHMGDVKKEDIVKAEHFMQLENLYNNWAYGSNASGSGSGTTLPGDDPNCMVASKIFNSLHCGYGLSVPVTCGIIGSAIFETSGTGATLASLDKNWNIYNSLGCYGLWQFCPFGAGIPRDKTVDGQIKHLMSPNQLPAQMTQYGSNYRPGFNYTQFKALQSPEQAAYAFRACYERGDYNSNANHFARMAYNYFKDKKCPNAGSSGSNPTIPQSSGKIGWPYAGGKGQVTQKFGKNLGGTSEYDYNHLGWDISVGYGTPLVAADNGTVIHAGYGEDWSYGISVSIKHNNGYTTRYAHMSGVTVRAGSVVSKGQVIGYEGTTGKITGSHVHFEIRQGGQWGKVVNPYKFFSGWGN